MVTDLVTVLRKVPIPVEEAPIRWLLSEWSMKHHLDRDVLMATDSIAAEIGVRESNRVPKAISWIAASCGGAKQLTTVKCGTIALSLDRDSD